ncbi:MAG: DUF2284 domain-containing protein [Clostridia bacterium]|nr:DUF2284 domain-containing protein [Clostridia bacterium]
MINGNENLQQISEELVLKAYEFGAFKAAVIPADEVVTDRSFRDICATNSCGKYGRCWTCPPDAGDIDELMASIKNFKHVLVYQTVGELEDSFDIEGMQECGKKHNHLVISMKKEFSGLKDALHLGAGSCLVCEKCAKLTNEPCRHPDLAIKSLESYGIYVSRLAASAGMKYINGQDTVTYFGAIFFNA